MSIAEHLLILLHWMIYSGDSKKNFDDIMHTTEDGSVEFWYARELMECLGFVTWRRFKEAIERAKESS